MSTADELVLFTEVDQDAPVAPEHKEILSLVEERIVDAIKRGDARSMTNICKSLVSITKIAGIALARVLWMIKENWEVFSINEVFEYYMSSVTGLHHRTIERYVRVYDMMDLVPANIKDQLFSKNIKNLIPIANAVAQGFEIEDDQWAKLAGAADYNEVAQIVRDDVKEASPRKSNLSLWVDDAGSMWAFHESRRYFVGSLEVESDDDVVQKAIRRILDNAGFLS